MSRIDARLRRLERARRANGRPVVVWEDEIARELDPAGHAAHEEAEREAYARMTAAYEAGDLAAAESARRDVLAALAARERWEAGVMAGRGDAAIRLRWPDEELILVRHSAEAIDGGGDAEGPSWDSTDD